MQQIHCLAIAVSAHDDVPNLIDHTAELQTSRLARVILVLEELTMRHKVSRISYHKHVSNVRVAAEMEKRILDRIVECISCSGD